MRDKRTKPTHHTSVYKTAAYEVPSTQTTSRLWLQSIRPPPATHLSQQFLGAVAALDVHQGIVGVADVTLTEGTQTQLHQGAVVQDLKPTSFIQFL